MGVAAEEVDQRIPFELFMIIGTTEHFCGGRTHIHKEDGVLGTCIITPRDPLPSNGPTGAPSRCSTKLLFLVPPAEAFNLPRVCF